MTKHWPVLVVDDEPDVFAVTRMALHGREYFGRQVELIAAGSAAEACDILSRRNDFALALIDVVMETDSAGFDVVRFIRQQMQNRSIRIVLRTGHLGEGTEVIAQYDIDGFLPKTELTSARLNATLYSSIRTHRLLVDQEKYIEQLHELIDELQRLGLELASDLTDPTGLASDDSLVMGEYIKGLVQQLRGH